MAQFYATVTGNGKSSATKTGTKTSGMSAHVRGWEAGVRVECSTRADGKNEFRVYRTGGSHIPDGELFAMFVEDEPTTYGAGG